MRTISGKNLSTLDVGIPPSGASGVPKGDYLLLQQQFADAQTELQQKTEELAAARDTAIVCLKLCQKAYVEDCYEMFAYDSTIENVPLFNTSRASRFYNMFSNCSSLKTVPHLDISNGQDFQYCFQDCTSLTEFPDWDFSHATKLFGLIQGCTGIEEVPTLDTSNCTDLTSIFWGCTSLRSVPAHLDTTKCTLMGCMFGNCPALTSVPTMDTSKATMLNQLYQNCTGLTTVPQLDTSKAEFMNSMFEGCSNLTSDLTWLDTSSVCADEYQNGGMSDMFKGCTKLKKVATIDAGHVVDYKRKFNGIVDNCPALTHLTIVNLGKSMAGTRYEANDVADLSGATAWGTGSEEARQTLVDSLLTNSFAKAFNVRISQASFNVLTDDEKTAIAAKGITLLAV